MIRVPTASGYLLVTHQEHARLAGRLAEHWGNSLFPPPAPPPLMPALIEAVARHDDAWAPRDAAPCLTREGRPSAFTRELVGAYSAFEEIDLADYLAVRGAATETLALSRPLSAILVSMHTVNLLTEQADPASLSPADRARLSAFVDDQLRRHRELAAALPPTLAAHATPGPLRRAFEFLQLCDNLSLLTCVRYDQPRPLRHSHPDATGALRTLLCSPAGTDTWCLDPWPFDLRRLLFKVPARHVSTADCADLPRFRAAYASAPVTELPIHLVAALA
jgi:hypothetical protein